MKKYFWLLLVAATMLWTTAVQAATFSLSPSVGTIIAGCPTTFDVQLSTAGGEQTNGAQIYIDHNFIAGESAGISGAGLFSTYGTPPGMLAGRLGLYGYGGIVSGNRVFGRVTVTAASSQIGQTKDLIIFFDNSQSITSKIADINSNNILSGVTSGSYNVIFGYCEHNPPYLTNMVPPPNTPNHPVDQDITFDLNDDSSGVDISSLAVTVQQNGAPLPITVTTQKLNAGDDKRYAVTIHVNNGLTRELRVDVTVIARDWAGNQMNRSYSFNDLTCAQLGCTAAPPSSTPQFCQGGGVAPTSAFATTTCPECAVCGVAASTTLSALNETHLHFYLANRSIQTNLSSAGIVEDLPGAPLAVLVDISPLVERVDKAQLTIGQNTYEMFYDNGAKMYAVDIRAPGSVGFYSSNVTVTHGNTKEIIPFTLSLLPRGVVYGKNKEGVPQPLSGVTVILEQRQNLTFSQIASQTTDAAGEYGFIVPDGNYRLVVRANGWREQQTGSFSPDNHIVNRIFTLIKIVDLLDPNTSLLDKSAYVVEIGKEQNIAPIAIAVTAAAVLPALSLINLLSYLRFLFLQPILLFGRRKREKWGTVYNTLTKLPIDLAVVRLVDVKIGKIVQSRVTDSKGRYAFFAEPGLYRLEVIKEGYIFPTKILQDYKEDTGFVDLYHGEPVHVDDKYVALAVNIPLDPIGAPEKTPRRLIWEKRWRSLQSFIAMFSIVVGIVAFALQPGWWTGSLFVLQIVLYFLFKRLGTPPKPKSWGIVYDRGNQKPIERTVARLFSKQFNKLVASEITDKNGRYSFMVGPNRYYVTFEKNGYRKEISPDIAVKQANEVIRLDVGLQKEIMPPGTSQPKPPTPTMPISTAKPPETKPEIPKISQVEPQIEQIKPIAPPVAPKPVISPPRPPMNVQNKPIFTSTEPKFDQPRPPITPLVKPPESPWTTSPIKPPENPSKI